MSGNSPGDGHHLQRVHPSLGVVGLLLHQARVNNIHHAFHSDAGFCNVGGHNDPSAVWRARGKHPCLHAGVLRVVCVFNVGYVEC